MCSFRCFVPRKPPFLFLLCPFKPRPTPESWPTSHSSGATPCPPAVTRTTTASQARYPASPDSPGQQLVHLALQPELQPPVRNVLNTLHSDLEVRQLGQQSQTRDWSVDLSPNPTFSMCRSRHCQGLPARSTSAFGQFALSQVRGGHDSITLWTIQLRSPAPTMSSLSRVPKCRSIARKVESITPPRAISSSLSRGSTSRHFSSAPCL